MGPRAHAGDLIHKGIDDLLPVQLHAGPVLVLQRKLRRQHPRTVLSTQPQADAPSVPHSMRAHKR